MDGERNGGSRCSGEEHGIYACSGLPRGGKTLLLHLVLHCLGASPEIRKITWSYISWVTSLHAQQCRDPYLVVGWNAFSYLGFSSRPAIYVLVERGLQCTILRLRIILLRLSLPRTPGLSINPFSGRVSYHLPIEVSPW